MAGKKITILGATGSIGENTLAVLSAMKEQYKIYGLSAHRQGETLLGLVKEHKPMVAVLSDRVAAAGQVDVMALLKQETELFLGPEGLLQACDGADLVVLGVVGIAGLPIFEYCLKKQIPVALATKEALVYGGQLARDLMNTTRTPVLPLDSEISAIFQCLLGNEKETVEEILLTASGGPFRTWPLERIKRATLNEALAHPNWEMGAKISIDSATMANKGLEMIEARWMFDIDPAKITVVVHPESIVHSMVRYVDGSIMAQLGATDMRLPIAYALNYPNRVKNVGEQVDLFGVGQLNFEQPDYEKFPCLKLAADAICGGDSLQMVFNAANDVAVALFRQGVISFWEIHELIERAMMKFAHINARSFEEIYHVDEEIRKYCTNHYGLGISEVKFL